MDVDVGGGREASRRMVYALVEGESAGATRVAGVDDVSELVGDYVCHDQSGCPAGKRDGKVLERSPYSTGHGEGRLGAGWRLVGQRGRPSETARLSGEGRLRTGAAPAGGTGNQVRLGSLVARKHSLCCRDGGEGRRASASVGGACSRNVVDKGSIADSGMRTACAAAGESRTLDDVVTEPRADGVSMFADRTETA